MTDDTQHPTAAAALCLAGDYPHLLAHAGAIKAQASGTIGRQSNVHGIPGGTAHHDFTREVRDTAFVYAEAVADARGLEDRALGDTLGNLRLIATHADALDHADPAVRADTTPTGETVTRPACPVEHRRQVDGQWQDDTPEDHLRCLAHRVRVHLEPPGAREFVGPCPTVLDDGAQECGLDLRAYDHGPARCPAGHVHDTATVRDQALTASRDRLLTMKQIHHGSQVLFGKQVNVKTLRSWARRGRLNVAGYAPDGEPLYRANEVAAAVA